jgi:hypothetical protein
MADLNKDKRRQKGGSNQGPPGNQIDGKFGSITK